MKNILKKIIFFLIEKKLIFLKKIFYKIPLPENIQRKLIRIYRNNTTNLDSELNSLKTYIKKNIHKNYKSLSHIKIPHDGCWEPSFFQENQDHIHAAATILSLPDCNRRMIKENTSIVPITDRPLITIIVRTYMGRWTFTKTALQSIKSQSYRPIEVIVVEDGTDTFSDKVYDLNTDGNCYFRHLTTGEKLGRSHAGNLGLNSAKGEFIGFLDDDDYLLENHCALLSSFLIRWPKIAAVYAASKRIEIHTKKDKKGQQYFDEKRKSIFFKLMAFSSDLFHQNCFPIQAILFRRSICSPSNRLDKNLDALEDWLFWLCMLLPHKVAMIAEITSVFHVPHFYFERKSRQETHEEAINYFNIQRNALYKIYNIKNLELILEQSRYLIQKAFKKTIR